MIGVVKTGGAGSKIGGLNAVAAIAPAQPHLLVAAGWTVVLSS